MHAVSAVPELGALLVATWPTCCAKLRLTSRECAAAFGAAWVDEAARRELVAAVLSAPGPEAGSMRGARAALAHPRVDEAAALALLCRLREWMPIVHPPFDNFAQRMAVQAGLPASLVRAVDRYPGQPRVLAAICEVIRRCCVHHAPGVAACLDAGAVAATLRLLGEDRHCRAAHPLDGRVRWNAMLAAQALAEYGDGAGWRLVQAGAIRLVAAAMAERREDLQLLCVGTRVLFSLADTVRTRAGADRVSEELEAALPSLRLPHETSERILDRARMRKTLLEYRGGLVAAVSSLEDRL